MDIYVSKTFFGVNSYPMGISREPIVELRQIRAFMAVADQLNFTRAAEVLHMAQPPLSRQIRDLEESLGVELFDRTTRSVSLTSAGKVFLDEVQPVFPQLEYAVEACRKAAGGQRGTLRLGYTGRASQALLPALLRHFHQAWPGVAVDIDGPHPSGHLRLDLMAGRLDVVLCFLPLAGDGIASRELLQTPLAIALPATHSLAAARHVAVADLHDEPFAAYPSGKGFHLRDAMEAECRRAGFHPRVVRETEASQTLLCLVAAGTGVAIIPAETQSLLTEGVVFKPLPRGAATLSHGIAWMKSNSNPALPNFLAIATPPSGSPSTEPGVSATLRHAKKS